MHAAVLTDESLNQLKTEAPSLAVSVPSDFDRN